MSFTSCIHRTFTGRGVPLFGPHGSPQSFEPRTSRFNCDDPQQLQVVDERTLRINLDAAPTIPSRVATLESNRRGGWVTVQNIGDDLFVDNRRVFLYLNEKQQRGQPVSTTALASELKKKPVLHPNIMDGLLDHQHLVPESWNSGLAPCIMFWGATFAAPHHPSFGNTWDSFLPRGMQCHNNAWQPKFMWRDFGIGLSPAAVFEE